VRLFGHLKNETVAGQIGAATVFLYFGAFFCYDRKLKGGDSK
jgi:hypothetical protein